MKVATTKVMANLLKRELANNEKTKGYSVVHQSLSEHSYKWNVELDIYDHYNDYNPKTNKYNVITIIYPPDYYACERHLTTNDLISCYKKSNKTLSGFISAVVDEIEI